MPTVHNRIFFIILLLNFLWHYGDGQWQCSGSSNYSINAYGTCNNKDIICNNSPDCTVGCTVDLSCYQSDIYGPNSHGFTIECSGTQACRSSTMHLTNASNSNIDCGGYLGCYNATIYCPQHGDCTVDCGNGRESCEFLKIFCYNSNSCSYNNCDGIATCNSANITYLSIPNDEATQNPISINTTESTIQPVGIIPSSQPVGKPTPIVTKKIANGQLSSNTTEILILTTQQTKQPESGDNDSFILFVVIFS